MGFVLRWLCRCTAVRLENGSPKPPPSSHGSPREQPCLPRVSSRRLLRKQFRPDVQNGRAASRNTPTQTHTSSPINEHSHLLRSNQPCHQPSTPRANPPSSHGKQPRPHVQNHGAERTSENIPTQMHTSHLLRSNQPHRQPRTLKLGSQSRHGSSGRQPRPDVQNHGAEQTSGGTPTQMHTSFPIDEHSHLMRSDQPPPLYVASRKDDPSAAMIVVLEPSRKATGRIRR